MDSHEVTKKRETYFSNMYVLVQYVPIILYTIHLENHTQEGAPHSTEVQFVSFLSGGFTTMTVINPPERKLAKRISVHCVMDIRKDVLKVQV